MHTYITLRVSPLEFQWERNVWASSVLLNFIFDASIDFIVLQKYVANVEFIAYSSSRKCVIVQDGLNIKDSCFCFAFQMLTSI